MLLLPTFQATLRPCPLSPADFIAHEKGHFCGHCQRVVQDFSQSENPKADLAAARAASPDGWVCGSFRREQVVAPPLTRRLKWFLLALVLVVGQGLTAREALAQVRKATPSQHQTTVRKQLVKAKPIPVAGDVEELPVKPHLITAVEPDLQELRLSGEDSEVPFLGTVVEQMPTFRGGGTQKLVEYIDKQVVWPKANDKIIQTEGRVFVSFTVDAQGQVRDAKVVKGFQPLFDAAALEAVRSLDGFKPAKSNGKPVSMGMTVPVNFRLK